MQYGAMNFPIRPILDEIDAIGRLGFDFLELAMDAPEAHYTTIEENMSVIKQALLDNHLGLVCHLPTFLYTADLTERIRKASLVEMVASVRTSVKLGASKAVLHPSLIAGMGALVPEKAMGYAWDALEIVLDESQKLGLRLCLENMFSSKFSQFVEPEDLAPFFNRFDSLELTLDTGHAHINRGRRNRILAFIDQYPNLIGHIHVSDNAGDWDAHLPVGKGTIPFKKVIAALKTCGYDSTMTLEIFTPNSRDLVRSRQRIDQMLFCE